MNHDNTNPGKETQWEDDRRRPESRISTGLFLLLLGGVLFLRTSHIVTFPSWFFSWGTFCIGLGLVMAVKHRFRPGFWLFFLLVGAFSLIDKLDPSLRMDQYMWPLILMVIGLTFILRPRKSSWRRCYRHERRSRRFAMMATGGIEADMPEAPDRGDIIDVTAVFGGVKKTVLTKNFRGGEVTSVMGGSEIDLTQADINGTVTIDVTTVFGGSKLIVPPTWDVQNDIAAVFGGVDDKRQVVGVSMDPNKVLILEGTCVFGGIEIRSY
ncbi:MAG: hypothetical protein JWP27_2267 [Flaviaesturariibacter sp.]|nr:hypothetical protein [Flaviaesturariibacter sp.]